MSHSVLIWLALALPAATPPAPSEEPAAPRVLQTVVVTGEQPGPGLWKVSRDGHVLWILGTLRPLPKRMTWVSREVETTLAGAQELVLAPTASLKVDGGMLGGLFLLPSLLGARNNPDDATLAEVLPADLYARWTALKEKYIGRSRSIEQRRPIFAAQRLYDKAIRRSGLTLEDRVVPVVRRAAKRHDVPITQPTIELKLEQPKAAVREFAGTALDDVECFRRTLDRLESDLEAMRERANAWAVGDIETLRDLPYTDQTQACADAFLQAEVTRRRGFDDLEQRLATAWLDAAEAALRKHAVSFATLPMAQIVEADGYVATLRERGCTVEEPGTLP